MTCPSDDLVEIHCRHPSGPTLEVRFFTLGQPMDEFAMRSLNKSEAMFYLAADSLDNNREFCNLDSISLISSDIPAGIPNRLIQHELGNVATDLHLRL